MVEPPGNGELAPAWRLLLAGAIVVGVLAFGLVLIYSWFFIAPLIILGALAVVLFRKMLSI